MLAILKTTPTGLKRLEEFEPGSWIDLVTPTEEELEQVSRELVIPLDLLKGPLDEEEKSRIDVEDGLTHVIVDIPVLVREEDQQGYETIPLGILIHPDYIITTCLRPNPILGEFEHGVVRGYATFWKTRLLLQILQRVAAFYLRYLGRIDRETDKVERELRASMKNAEIFDLLSLQKSLVYFTTSLRSNEGVLQKLNAHQDRQDVRRRPGVARGRSGREQAGLGDGQDLHRHLDRDDGRVHLGDLEQPEPGDEAPHFLHHHPGYPDRSLLILGAERQSTSRAVDVWLPRHARRRLRHLGSAGSGVLEEEVLLAPGRQGWVQVARFVALLAS